MLSSSFVDAKTQNLNTSQESDEDTLLEVLDASSNANKEAQIIGSDNPSNLDTYDELGGSLDAQTVCFKLTQL